MSKFFVYRPVFAWVIAILIMLAGVIGMSQLPISQYPNIAPPSVKISATYPGANAETLENSVTQIIEQQLTGIDGLLYFSSSSSSSGSVGITVTFAQGTDADTAQVQVQNKVQQALSRLPSEVQAQGVTVTKSQSDFLMILSVYDETGKNSSSNISDWLSSNLQDPISRTNGVGSVMVFGGEHAMRIWLDPQQLKKYKLNPSEIVSAIKEQNVQVSVGQIGSAPSTKTQMITATVHAQSRFTKVEQFENIILKSESNGSKVYLKDVAKVELGNSDYSTDVKLNGFPASGMAVMLAPGANALDTSDAVKKVIEEMKPNFPDGYKVGYPKDSTNFIKLSVEEVVHTLIEAIVLVVVVMYLFLQNLRATIIPAIAVPVVLLGTFGVLAVFGYSINTLTLFAMVLAIGLLVDDAIVVVENVERIMTEEKLSAKEATAKSMGEISGALIAIAVVLSAVFLPMSFFAGSTGVIYRQFSITLISAMALSVVVALTLTPALCGSFLKHSKKHEKGFFKWFNNFYDKTEHSYADKVVSISKKKKVFVAIYLLIGVGLYFSINKLPTGFIPTEDQGDVMIMYTLPSGASLNRTKEVSKEVQDYFANNEKNNAKYVFTISGFNFMGTGSNAGMAFVALSDWSERTTKESSADSIAMRAMISLNQKIKDAQVFAMTPPAIMGLGQSNGFTLQLQALNGTSREELEKLKNELLQKANSNPILTAVRANELPNNAQLQINVDNEKATALGVSLGDITNTLSYAWGGSYIGDFIDNGRVKRVYIQGEADSRMQPTDLNKWHVRNDNGEMTPFGSITDTYWSYGPDNLNRFNGISAYNIQGSASAGYSSGQAMAEMIKLVKELPKGATWSWSDLSYQEQQAGSQGPMLYALSILVVFLCLAALYESWSVPISVITVIPLGVIGAVLAASFRGIENDVYFQVALLTTIGLSCKNAILIVEFAELMIKEGKSVFASIVLAAKHRLRPILMTSFAFIAGVLPLALSSGAGANSRIEIGTGIIGGTLSATILAIFFVPLFFIIIKNITIKFNNKEKH